LRESRRIEGVQSPVIPVVGELVRANPGTISLGQGVVHYGPPREAMEAIGRFGADPENHKYKPVQGIPPLLDAIERKLAEENRLRIESRDSILVTAGSNMGFMNALLAIADPGDEIILQTPYYFNHEMAVTMASCRPVNVATTTDYQLDLDAIADAITPRTRAVVTISPNNPTGAVYPEAALRHVNAVCRERGMYHIHDEAYEYFTYGGAAHFSPCSIPGSESHTISLFSLSKSYGFAGWRIGYMVVPPHLVTAVKKIQDTNLICAPVVSQHAAVGALEAGSAYCRAQIASIADVRDIAIAELRAVEHRCIVPNAQGAFYLLLRVRTEMDSMDLVRRLTERHGVAVLPGSTFGIEDCCTIRAAYGALCKETAVEGIGRLVEGLGQLDC
jgi:aspartate/methionine/tyrosine aminotransferase